MPKTKKKGRQSARTAAAMRAQIAALNDAMDALGLGPVALSRALNTPYDTFKSWLSGRRQMPGAAGRCLELLLQRPATARKLSRLD